jgi:flagellar L-ring protein FlgH
MRKFSSHNLRSLSCSLALLGGASLCGCITIQSPSAQYQATWPQEPEPAATTSGAIYSVGHDVPLFENTIAHRIGDTVTIRLQESTNASKSSSTATSKATEIDIGTPTGIGSQLSLKGAPLGFGMENENTFNGSGTSAQSNSLQGQITVTVAKRLANGNLLVRGQKLLTLNQGSEFVRIQGIVRPADIDPDNSVPSFKVADAKISYGGRGALADANAPGLLSRFFNSKWLPF